MIFMHHICPKVVFTLAAFLMLPAWAHAWEFKAGPGMEYFTVKTYARDPQGRYFENILQTTLAAGQVTIAEGPVRLAFQGGWSDWNVSSEWRGHNVVPFQFDTYWSGQTYYQAQIDLWLLPDWSVGAQWRDHKFRFYTGETQFTFLEYRERRIDARLSYYYYRQKDLNLAAGLLYAPAVDLVASQNTGLDPAEDVLQPYTTAVQGRQLTAEFTLAYQHDAGWGLDFVYQLGWADFPAPEGLADYALTMGRLLGTFWLRF